MGPAAAGFASRYCVFDGPGSRWRRLLEPARKVQRQRIEGRTAAESLQQFEQATPGTHGGIAEVFAGS
jgi:5'-3' exonuclease